jgi:C-terminal processing protease CtpA/Prc
MGAGSSKGAGGFRVFRVFPDSPAAEAGLEVFFDYVVEVDGNVVESEQQSFFSMIKVCNDFCVSAFLLRNKKAKE